MLVGRRTLRSRTQRGYLERRRIKTTYVIWQTSLVYNMADSNNIIGNPIVTNTIIEMMLFVDVDRESCLLHSTVAKSGIHIHAQILSCRLSVLRACM